VKLRSDAVWRPQHFSHLLSLAAAHMIPQRHGTLPTLVQMYHQAREPTPSEDPCEAHPISHPMQRPHAMGFPWHLVGAGRRGLGLNPKGAFRTHLGRLSDTDRFWLILSETLVSYG
jgi:hypothetical protein